jgi:hypothetical protein
MSPEDKPSTDDPIKIATQAGLQKAFHDEIAKGLKAAALSLSILNDQERENLRAEAENSYHNAVYLLEQAGSLPALSVIQKLRQLGRFLEKQNTQEEGN